MRRVLSTVLAVALLLGLGALAVLALPNANASLAQAPVVSAAAPEYNPDAPAATKNYNNIALPLDSRSQFATYDADGLAALVGGGVAQVLHWLPATQQYEVRSIDPLLGNSGQNFGLSTGGSYWLLLDSTATKNVLSFVGNVPAQKSVTFNMTTGTPCKYNQFSVPLDQSIANADALGASLGATQVLYWDAATQQYQVRSIDPLLGNSGQNFTVQIGYPYSACLPTGAPTVWPVYP